LRTERVEHRQYDRRWRDPWGLLCQPAVGRQRFDVGDAVFGAAARQHLAAALGEQHVVFDADADAAKLLGSLRRRRDVEPRLDGEHHAGYQRPRRIVHAVAADVVHVASEPVAGAVHVEALVGFLGDRVVDGTIE
jgi:hypothetical protein